MSITGTNTNGPLQEQEQQQPLSKLIQTFLYSLKSKETQRMYLYYLDYFEKFHGKPIDNLLSLHGKVIEEILIKYIISMRDKGLSSSTVSCRLTGVLSFLDVNDITINHKKLKRFMGESKKTVRDEAYTHQDLTNMFEVGTFRTKVIIAIYSSTGIRKSALIDLKLKHLERIDNDNQNLYKFTI